MSNVTNIHATSSNSVHRILVVDDSKTIRQAATIYLSNAGYAVESAEDGFKALHRILEFSPDLVFMDVLMPRLDGYQTSAIIKSNPRFSALPIVMLSSKDGLFDIAKGRMVGVDSHMTKPFAEKALVGAAMAHIRPPPRNGI